MTIFNDTAQFLRDIYGKLDSADTQIFEMRKELETEAKKESVEFYKKFQFLIVEIETLKEFGSNMLRDSALELLGSCR